MFKLVCSNYVPKHINNTTLFLRNKIFRENAVSVVVKNMQIMQSFTKSVFYQF
jgi:hypothetical protein